MILQPSDKLSTKPGQLHLPDGISMMNNNGAFNDLGHYHLHVFPRYRGDGFRWISDGPGIKGREFLDRELKRLMNYV